jgi:pimeloyl-ACP methyl ester carboxylesterase
MAAMPQGFLRRMGLRWVLRQLEDEASLAQPGELAFWKRSFSELYDSPLMTKDFFVSRGRVLTDSFARPPFTPGDLDAWRGRVFILESENDRVVEPDERERLKHQYPAARVHTFRGAGHLGGGLFRVEETVALVEDFLAGDATLDRASRGD